MLDSIQAKKIIKELIEKDALVDEVKLLIKMDSISKSRILTLQKSNDMLMSAYKEKDLQVLNLNAIISNNDKIISREKSKNKFLKFVSLLSVATTGILLITR